MHSILGSFTRDFNTNENKGEEKANQVKSLKTDIGTDFGTDFGTLPSMSLQIQTQCLLLRTGRARGFRQLGRGGLIYDLTNDPECAPPSSTLLYENAVEISWFGWVVVNLLIDSVLCLISRWFGTAENSVCYRRGPECLVKRSN